MELSHDEMVALSLIEVGDLPITDAQKNALGKMVQSLRQFLAHMQDLGAAPSGKNGLHVVK